MSEWQPIETAPKDGTEVIGYVAESRHVRQPCVKPIFWSAGHAPEGCDPGSSPQWCASGVVHYSVEPTHWMPLPEAPNELSDNDLGTPMIGVIPWGKK